jgi:hypothetical protein
MQSPGEKEEEPAPLAGLRKAEVKEDDADTANESEPSGTAVLPVLPPDHTDEETAGPTDPDAGADPEGDGEPASRHRRKTGLLVIAGTVIVAIVAVSFVLMNGDSGSGEPSASGVDAGPSAQAALPAPSVTSGSAPDDSVTEGSVADTPAGESAGPSHRAGPTSGDSASASASSPVTGHTGQDATPSSSPTGPPVTPDPTNGPSTTGGHPVLREGDQGPEVIELQKRMGQLLLLYIGLPDGEYDAGVEKAVARYQADHDIEGDAKGVYGPATRSDLESRTREP